MSESIGVVLVGVPESASILQQVEEIVKGKVVYTISVEDFSTGKVRDACMKALKKAHHAVVVFDDEKASVVLPVLFACMQWGVGILLHCDGVLKELPVVPCLVRSTLWDGLFFHYSKLHILPEFAFVPHVLTEGMVPSQYGLPKDVATECVVSASTWCVGKRAVLDELQDFVTEYFKKKEETD